MVSIDILITFRILKNVEIQESAPFIINEEVEYARGCIVIKTILRKITGSISVIAFDFGEVLVGKISPFEILIQVIEGSAEVAINDKPNFLEPHQSIIIPAHTSNSLKANKRFKIISTVIKCGYEEVT